MNAAKQAGWLFCALFALACSGWYFASSSKVIKLDANTLSITPDAIISSVLVRQFGPDGQLVNAFQARELRHIPANNVHYLIAPLIIVRQNQQPAWQIQANRARATNGDEKITFLDNVKIFQEQTDRSQASTITMDSLTYYPKTKFATTDSEVTFSQPGTIVQSKGMDAYLEEKRVILLNQARATYEPKHA